MARHAAGKLISGLVVGAAFGATIALVLSSRSGAAVARATPGASLSTGPTPFEPANVLIEKARHLVDDVRSQVRLAVAEGKSTAALTRQELTIRFEAAKRGQPDEKT